jgi:type IX secretion system PorP/SprF family membrane protein
MSKRLYNILLIIVFIPVQCFGQEINPGPGYQMILMSNPALAGSEGDGVMRLSYLNAYPGNNYNLHSVYFSYDSFFPVLHGGAGIYLSDNYLGGIVNDIRGGLTYSYYIQVGKDLFINAGLSASVFHRGFNFNGAVLPDQIDPLGGVSYTSFETLSNTGKTVFDLGSGFLFIAGKVFGGFSINHLTEPDLSADGTSDEKINRKLFIHLAGDIDLNETRNLKIRPLGFFGAQKGFIEGGLGTVLESNYMSINVILLGDTGKNVDIQTGFSINAGKLSIYYNYIFSIASGNNLVPLSLLHQAGLAFSLNSVDKRKTIKTINLPNL